MAIVIRHGSNGAMKSATAVDKYMVPAIKKGRTVVTNLRGVSLERCYQVFPDLPSDLEVIFVDTEHQEGKKLFAKWFHWAPLGALIIVDEASSLFPKSWRETHIRELDYPGGLDAATEAGRPADWVSAWEMHRHFNWDIVLTTPNIKNIRDDIRNTTEMAYRQRSLGRVMSEKFRMYKEVQHDATKNGFTHSDAISVGTQRISKQAFELYDSTKTGIAQESNAGKSIFANPKILLLGAFLLGSIYFAASLGGPSFTAEAKAPDRVPIDSAPVVSSQGSSARSAVSSGAVGNVQPRKSDFVSDPLAEHDLRLLGHFDGVSQILATSDTDKVLLTPRILSRMGYAFFPISDCVARLEYKGQSRLLLCGKKESETDKENDSLIGSA